VEHAVTTPRTHVKVCGLRRREDVELCESLGVELLGFNCWRESPRYVEPHAIRAAVAPATDGMEVVLVFVRAAPEEVRRVVDEADVPKNRLWIQLHGDEDPNDYAHLGLRIIQVLRVGGADAMPPLPALPRVLIDVRASTFGGTGQRIDSESVESLIPKLPREWILAGGLNAENVGEAIRRFLPWGVDVASGVETSPGVKDPMKLQAFVKAAREARDNGVETHGQP
jgi:phosphoribosylanthranilate isomerase